MVVLGVVSTVLHSDFENSGKLGSQNRVRTVAVLRSQEELTKYLNYINQYYAIRGRARFGKRAEQSEGVSIDDY